MLNIQWENQADMEWNGFDMRFLKDEFNIVQIIKLIVMIMIGGFGGLAIFEIINLLREILNKL